MGNVLWSLFLTPVLLQQLDLSPGLGPTDGLLPVLQLEIQNFCVGVFCLVNNLGVLVFNT